MLTKRTNAKAEHEDDIFEDQKRVKNVIKTKEQSLEDVYSKKNLDHANLLLHFSELYGQNYNLCAKIDCSGVKLQDFV